MLRKSGIAKLVVSLQIAMASTTVAFAGVTVSASDTPMVVPDGGAGVAESAIFFPLEDVVTSVELDIAITFRNPADSGMMADFVGPNTTPPPGGTVYLLAGSGGGIYIHVTQSAAQTCGELCQSGGCGSPGEPVTCRPFDSPFESLDSFVGENSLNLWMLRLGWGPPTADTVLESWSITLSGPLLDRVIFFDGFESGDTLAWTAELP